MCVCVCVLNMVIIMVVLDSRRVNLRRIFRLTYLADVCLVPNLTEPEAGRQSMYVDLTVRVDSNV